MTKHHILASAASLALALGGCGRSDDGGNVAMERGEWETTMQVTNVRMDNLPPGLRDDFGRMSGNRTQTTRGCWTMTADLIRIENLRFAIPELSRGGPECTIAELLMEGGRLRARMSCTGIPADTGGGDGTMTMWGELDGSYTATSLQASASGNIRFGAQSGSADVRITSRRLGPCPPRPVYRPPTVPMDYEGNSSMNVAVPVLPVDNRPVIVAPPGNGM